MLISFRKQIFLKTSLFVIIFAFFFTGCNAGSDNTTAYTIRFISNGGSAIKNTTAKKESAITKPQDPSKKGYKFSGWYNDDHYTQKWDFDTDTVEGALTLYAKWGRIFSDLSELNEYLDSQAKNTKETPIVITLENYDLGNMANASSGWKILLDLLNSAAKFVELDLSACALTGEVFNANNSTAAGKDRIVSLITPDAATSIQSGNGWSEPAFKYFTYMRFTGGANITIIGQYTFCNNSSLLDVDFPQARNIGLDAFSGCIYLSRINFPNVQNIEESAFYGCTHLSSVHLPHISNIEKYAFGSTGSTAITMYLGEISPKIKEYLFLSVYSRKTVTIIVPEYASGYSGSPDNIYDNNWGNAFRGMGRDETGYLAGPVNPNINLIIEYR